VIPGATQRQISAVATVPAAAAVSATQTHAVVLLYVNQTTTMGSDSPTDTASRVKVTLEKVNDRWLISQFEPI
jgi:Mce-associated membrane protein